MAVAAALFLPAARAPATGVILLADGAYTLAQASRGEALYTEHCLICHGEDLQGDFAFAPPIGGESFSIWKGRSIGDIFAFVTESMPYDFPGELEHQTYADVIAFILQFTGYPAGEVELPPDLQALLSLQVVSMP